MGCLNKLFSNWLYINDIKLRFFFVELPESLIFATSKKNTKTNNMAEYKVLYKSGDELKEFDYRFDRFRKAYQFINNGSSNGYTKYFADLVEIRYGNHTRFSKLRHPSVLVKIQGRRRVSYYSIVDVSAECWYEYLRSIQESEEAGE